MDTKRIHDQIIKRALTRGRQSEYVESHHIVPRSMGGSDDPSNLVFLTAREHLIVHKLMVRHTEGAAKRKAINAYWAMVSLRSKDTSGRLTLSTREFEKARTLMVKARTGVPRSDATKAKVSESLKRHFKENGCHNKGRSYSHLTKEQRSLTFGIGNKGRKQSQEEKDRRASALKGQKRSEEVRQKMRIAAAERERVKRLARL